jgi:hypothetical protein
MKKLKKIIGYIIILFFVILVISVFIYNIVTAGWFFILTLIIGFVLMGLFLLGIHLLNDSNEAE